MFICFLKKNILRPIVYIRKMKTVRKTKRKAKAEYLYKSGETFIMI